MLPLFTVLGSLLRHNHRLGFGQGIVCSSPKGDAMRRALGRSSERALQALARAASSSSAAAHQQQAVLPAEVAQLVSQRSRLAALPADVEAAVAAAAAGLLCHCRGPSGHCAKCCIA